MALHGNLGGGGGAPKYELGLDKGSRNKQQNTSPRDLGAEENKENTLSRDQEKQNTKRPTPWWSLYAGRRQEGGSIPGRGQHPIAFQAARQKPKASTHSDALGRAPVRSQQLRQSVEDVLEGRSAVWTEGVDNGVWAEECGQGSVGRGVWIVHFTQSHL